MAESKHQSRKRPPPVERLLAGDLSSPIEVLAADELTHDQKREVLETWRDDLKRRRAAAEHEDLLYDVEDALKSLEALRKSP